MTPQERLYTAISGGVPDRVPVVPKIWVDCAANLVGLDLRMIIEKPSLALEALVDAGLALGLDGIRLFHLPRRATIAEDGKVFEIDRDGRRLGEIDMQGGLATHLYDPADFPLEDPYKMAHVQFWVTQVPLIRSLSDVKRINVPDKKFYEEIGWGKRERAALARAAERVALIGDCHSATLAFYVSLRGLANALLDLIEEPQLVHAAMEKGVAMAVERGKFHIDQGIKILRLNDSVANMSVISPGHWREFIFPHIKEVCDELHRYDPSVRIYCHICGNILPVMDLLCQTGLDCIGPLDPLGGFTCAQAREAAGEGIALMGGVNTLSFVEKTPEEIRQEARLCMLGAGRKGAYILGSGCVVPRHARPENLAALVSAAQDYGVYYAGEVRCT
ncbi:MAG: uroporphyrinogen decarboxylase family protein [Bacillota bacterium]